MAGVLKAHALTKLSDKRTIDIAMLCANSAQARRLYRDFFVWETVGTSYTDQSFSYEIKVKAFK